MTTTAPMADQVNDYLWVLAHRDIASPHSVNLSAADLPSHAPAARNNILSSQAFAAHAVMLTPLGCAVLEDPRLSNFVDVDVIEAIKRKALNSERSKRAAQVKALLMDQLGVTKLATSVTCDGCGRYTENVDRWNNHFCMKNRKCKATARQWYVDHGVAAKLDRPKQETQVETPTQVDSLPQEIVTTEAHVETLATRLVVWLTSLLGCGRRQKQE